MPLNMGVEKLADDFDMDGDGLINREERAFLCDPAVPDSPDVITSSGVRGGPLEFTFNCAAGASSPRICILSSEDMVSWQIETSCQSGGKFQSPDLVTLSESPWKTGRAVTVRPAPSTRRFWRVAVQLSP